MRPTTDAVLETISYHKKAADQTKEMLIHAHEVDEFLQRFKIVFPLLTVSANNTTITLVLRVEKIADSALLLEVLQQEFGWSPDQDSGDQWAEYRCRDYKSSTMPWLMVSVFLKDDGPECRRVQVGTKEVPVYELRCGDDNATA